MRGHNPFSSLPQPCASRCFSSALSLSLSLLTDGATCALHALPRPFFSRFCLALRTSFSLVHVLVLASLTRPLTLSENLLPPPPSLLLFLPFALRSAPCLQEDAQGGATGPLGTAFHDVTRPNRESESAGLGGRGRDADRASSPFAPRMAGRYDERSARNAGRPEGAPFAKRGRTRSMQGALPFVLTRTRPREADVATAQRPRGREGAGCHMRKTRAKKAKGKACDGWLCQQELSMWR